MMVGQIADAQAAVRAQELARQGIVIGDSQSPLRRAGIAPELSSKMLAVDAVVAAATPTPASAHAPMTSTYPVVVTVQYLDGSTGEYFDIERVSSDMSMLILQCQDAMGRPSQTLIPLCNIMAVDVDLQIASDISSVSP